MKVLAALARVFALLGAAVALATASMVVVSIAGRAWFAAPIQGDVEITQIAVALAISLGLPWCQLHRGNIIVDFFTQRLRERHQRRLDGLGALLIAAMCALLAWRTAVGAMAVREAGETTMIVSLPMWWAYASLAPGLALASLIALHQAWRGWRGLPPDAAATDEASAVNPDGVGVNTAPRTP
jgi:TRAP-type C4-dicarboxylate transport system permease small subunit